MTVVRSPFDEADGSAQVLDELAYRATCWVIRLTSGRATASDIAAFRFWRDEHPDHAAALADARRDWLAFGHATLSEETSFADRSPKEDDPTRVDPKMKPS